MCWAHIFCIPFSHFSMMELPESFCTGSPQRPQPLGIGESNFREYSLFVVWNVVNMSSSQIFNLHSTITTTQVILTSDSHNDHLYQPLTTYCRFLVNCSCTASLGIWKPQKELWQGVREVAIMVPVFRTFWWQWHQILVGRGNRINLLLQYPMPSDSYRALR